MDIDSKYQANIGLEHKYKATLVNVLQQMAMAALYFFIGYLFNHHLAFNGVITVIWPGSGIVLAAMLICGRKYLPGILMGSIILNVVSNSSPISMIGITLANLIEAFAASAIILARGRDVLYMESLKDYLYIIAAGSFACIIGAFIGCASLFAAGAFDALQFTNAMFHWWMGDALGVIVLTPAILSWSLTRTKDPFDLKIYAESVGLLLLALLVGQIVFLGSFDHIIGDDHKGSLAYLFITMLAVRTCTGRVSLAMTLFAAQGLFGVLAGIGNFSETLSRHSLSGYWVYMVAMSVIGMTVSIYVTNMKKTVSLLKLKDGALYATANSVAITDKNGIFTWVNQAFVNTSGYEYNELVGKENISIIRSGVHSAEFFTDLWQTIKDKRTWRGDMVNQRKDGSIYEEDASFTAILDNFGNITNFISVRIDITKRKQVETELRVASAAFQSQEGILITDERGKVLRVNAAFVAITGYSNMDIVGKNPNILQSGRHTKEFYDVMWQQVALNGYWSGEIWNKRKNGEIYPEYLTITAIKDANGFVINYVATMTDSTKIKKADEEIRKLAFYDQLTSLPNRRLLYDRIQQSISVIERSNGFGAVIFLDLDNFKMINDTLGHDTGDVLLCMVADRLTDCVRASDTVARLGGDEFVILMGDLDADEATMMNHVNVVANKVLTEMNRPFTLGTYKHDSSSSLGVTIFNKQTEGVDDILKQADIAMYQTKKAGRNGVRFFDKSMQASIDNIAAIATEIRDAVADQQFYLCYQAQVDQYGFIFGAEVLVRWDHPQGKFISPGDFIPIAEENGVIIPLGNWILETACAQLQIWSKLERTKHLTISINVSPVQFKYEGFIDQVTHALRTYKVNPELIHLELTEGMLVENIDATIYKMLALTTLGIKFSLDDFGTGYSSLQYLKKLPLYQLKIDQSFVKDLENDVHDQSIVWTIISMAKSLGLEVIAEGVENEFQKDRLIDKGCKYFQGYLFSKPLKIKDFEVLLRDNRSIK